MPVPKSCLSKDKDHPTDFCVACLKAEIERLRQFIIDAPCPHCDGSGGIRIAEDEWEQCRWCSEKDGE